MSAPAIGWRDLAQAHRQNARELREMADAATCHVEAERLRAEAADKQRAADRAMVAFVADLPRVAPKRRGRAWGRS